MRKTIKLSLALAAVLSATAVYADVTQLVPVINDTSCYVGADGQYHRNAGYVLQTMNANKTVYASLTVGQHGYAPLNKTHLGEVISLNVPTHLADKWTINNPNQPEYVYVDFQSDVLEIAPTDPCVGVLA